MPKNTEPDAVAQAVAKAKRNSDGTITVYPVEGAHLYPYESIQQDITPELADELLRYTPAPFTLDKESKS